MNEVGTMAGPARDAALRDGAAHHRAGRLREAERAYRRVLAAEPGNAEALHRLGVLAYQVGKHDRAVALVGKALQARPDAVEYLLTLGAALQGQGRVDAAIAVFRRARELDPHAARTHYNLGVAFNAKGMRDAALASYRRAIALKPDFADAYNNMGMILALQGKAGQAVAAYRRAIELNPGFGKVYYNLGNVLLDANQPAQAEAMFRRAADRDPGLVQAYNNLGLALKRQGKNEEAIEAFRRAVAAEPKRAEAHVNLGDALQEIGDDHGAAEAYSHYLAIEPAPGVAVRRAILVPRVAESMDDLRRARARFEAEVAALEDSAITLADPLREVAQTNFHLAYHGRDDRPLQEALARFYLKACPSLAWQAPPPPRRARLRVGIASRYFRSHAVSLCFGGLVERLDRDRFEVVLFSVEAGADAVTKRLRAAADRAVWLPRSLEEARRAIADEALDVLVYADLGMDPITYFLAFARLAPVQCVLSGHPVTSGIPTVDHFVSAGDNEPPGAEAHYSETLVRMTHGLLYYRRPARPRNLRAREDFGFGAGDHVYACPQNVIKIHPEYDAVLAAILRRDPAARIVLIESKTRSWTERLARRLGRTMPDVVDRVTWVPHLKFMDFLSLIIASDVLLDPIHFGGGNTTRQALAFDKPVVTLPGAYLRGRMAYGCYARMGVDDCVAADLDDYVDIAVGLGTDAERRRAVAARIAEASPILYENDAAVREFEAFLERAAADAR